MRLCYPNFKLINNVIHLLILVILWKCALPKKTHRITVMTKKEKIILSKFNRLFNNGFMIVEMKMLK